MTAHERLLLPENLNYAWNKAKRLYLTLDGYTFNGELAEFELNLEERLIEIQKQFRIGLWRTKKLRPLPRPKKIENNIPIDRQYYHISVEDQVAWIAVVNALGPSLDQRMPPWSYGNRIYRPAWYEHGEDRHSTLEIGPYRHASGHLYRKFQHSWPLFRRHVALTARAMAQALPSDPEELDQADRLATISAKKEGLRYLQDGFWMPKKGSKSKTTLYHASIDLKHFYPSLRTDAVLNGLACSGSIDDRMRNLLAGMLTFRLDKSEMPPDTLSRVEPGYDRLQVQGIPTGLFVAGFLSNAAMLPVDEIANNQIEEKRSLAHFRFVDDHIILSYDFDELCEWIDFYRNLLCECDTGTDVNPEKFDPIDLREWMETRSQELRATRSPSAQGEERRQKVREAAIHNTEFDGANPTQLLTKTLGQISAIAAANVDILNDEDLEERLKLLEWLLLANIPEREIRPDTRAAFAAGRIAVLAPILVRETEGLVETARSLAVLETRAPNPDSATPKEIADHKSALEGTNKRLTSLLAAHAQGEERQLRHCFGLLIQAFREYPGKPRLFYRMHEYCRVTGFRGLNDIAKWIKEARSREYSVWADYYAGLSLHILARGILLAVRTLLAEDALRSEQEAAQRHLDDICQIDTEAFLVRQENQAWFHGASRIEFGVVLLSVAEVVRHTVGNGSLGARLAGLAGRYVHISFHDPSEVWARETGQRPGVWAHIAESVLSIDGRPTASWKKFSPLFLPPHISEVRAARRYPEYLSDAGWYHLLHSKKPLPKTDSGWLRETMDGNEKRINAALDSKKVTFARAARSLRPPLHGWMTLTEWTRVISEELSPFDPRRSEWTALEVIRQLVFPIVHQFGIHQSRLDRLHPNNILVPEAWKVTFPNDHDRAGVSWEEWRSFSGTKPSGQIRLRAPATSILDYRYFTETQGGPYLNEWERRLVGVGRLLLGQLRLNHEAPRIWNVRGNEHVFPLPRTHWFRSLAISSPTLLLVEGCLGTRSAETRSIARSPGLFGWIEGQEPNDANFDPPLLLGPNELLTATANAQRVLVDNQLAVAMNQPRQIIPFRLSDFAAGPSMDGEADAYDK